MSDEESVPLYKIVLAGDLGVGKTSIFRRYDIDKFSDYREPTFGLDKLSKDIKVDGKRLKVSVQAFISWHSLDPLLSSLLFCVCASL